tara:strand:+ start:5552 stop:6859 length:1308 start_codon:yes stop_codon:yes gene_type:complete
MSTPTWPFLPNPAPTRLSHAKDCYLYLENGDKVLDAAGGAIVANIGHGRQRVADAIAKASANTSYTVPTFMTPERERMLTELHEHWLPSHLSHVHVTCSGSEGNEAAMKMAVLCHAAQGHPERNVILARDVSYHGTTLTTAAVSGHPGRQKGLMDYLPECPRIKTPYPLRCPVGSDPETVINYYLDDLRSTIASIGSERIAALIAEPINGSSGGAIEPPEGYWPQAEAILKENGILLIMDEVMTGFGRLGHRFGAERYDLTPDLLVSGKGLAGGYAAITGVFGTAAISEAIAEADFGLMFHTFSALPQSCAAATEVLSILREEQLIERCTEIGDRLKQMLVDRLGQHPRVAEIRGQGLLIALEVVEDRETLTPYPESDRIADKLVAHALDNGAFFYPGGTGVVRDIVTIGAPYTMVDEDLDLIVDTLDGALASLN